MSRVVKCGTDLDFEAERHGGGGENEEVWEEVRRRGWRGRRGKRRKACSGVDGSSECG